MAARALPLSTRRSAPQTMPTAPTANLTRFTAISFFPSIFLRPAASALAFMERFAELTFSHRKKKKMTIMAMVMAVPISPATPDSTIRMEAASIRTDFMR